MSEITLIHDFVNNPVIIVMTQKSIVIRLCLYLVIRFAEFCNAIY